MTDNPQTKVAHAQYRASSWIFFLLVIVFSVPLYVVGAAGDRLPFATFLPVNALATFVPAIAALFLVYQEGGARGARQLLARALDYRRIKSSRWVLAALFLMPIVFIVEQGVLSVEGRALPEMQFFSTIEITGFFLMFFVGAVGEELGWQGYAYAGLEKGRSALSAALIIGVIWALWHLIPFVEMGRSLDWVLWQCAGAIVLRVIIVWLFVNSGQSVFIAVLLHTMINVPWGVVSNYEPFYDPFLMFVILALVTGTIVALWGPSSLARLRYARKCA